ncbi:hypothetical protein BN7_3487 [Wickerhamomyces ciferrii]|uniref:K Homology domain-containing protein n=1 Tax=Wickerhamomyces ciferrii (strain ATCC 14091 / BCRC 22168 / CBS 111 / JCM 3599 / NBRC 0793 / NRRL Y-1031 F-60-10) TaxID=1206466 RepID=K0KP17_WICCF|nr:uncharacterized protein BN7_3487 [Wickerhamomyces ciferrii]CCH43932.1 hypothetical protein BN7_3487 [Wickerhamomyces ciferrii]
MSAELDQAHVEPSVDAQELNGNNAVSDAVDPTETAATSTTDAGDATVDADASDAEVDAEESTNTEWVPKKEEVPPPSINDETAFPALGGSSGASASPISWGPSMKTSPVPALAKKSATRAKGSTIQDAFNIVSELSLNVSKIEFSKIINELKKNYGVSIESTLSSITKTRSFIVSGKPKDVPVVKKELIRRLTKPVQVRFKIPSRTRSAVIGSSGKNLKPIIESTQTRINIERNSSPAPGQSNDNDEDDEIEVTIDGDVEGVEDAKSRILHIVNEETKNLTTRINVPEEIVKFVENFNVNEDNLKISGPNKNNVISLQGLRDDVLIKKAEILSQLETLKIKVKSEVKIIPKQFHDAILPNEILKQFNVVVELPDRDADDESVSFIGLQSNIEKAIAFAKSETGKVSIEILDISKAHGGNVHHAASLAAYFAYSGLINKIGTENDTKISIPSYKKLSTQGLRSVGITLTSSTDKLDSKKIARKQIVEQVNKLPPSRVQYITDISSFFSKQVGSAVETSSKAQNVAVVPFSHLSQGNTNEIILIALDNEDDEFAPSQDEINERLSKVNESLNELRKLQADLKTTTLDVSNDKQQFIEGPKGTTLKALLKSFEEASSSIIIKLHSNGESESLDQVYLQGNKSDVAKAEKEINNLLKDAENVKDIYSYSNEVSVPANVLSRLIGKNGANLNALRDQFSVSIDVEDNASGEKASLKITGYKYNVEEAKTHIQQSSKRWADEITKTLHIQQKYHGSLIGAGGQYAKRLQDKYHVRIIFTQGSDDVVIRGPSRGAVKAEEEIKELLDYLIDNGYTKELQVPTKSLSRVIGKSGETIRGIATDAGIEIDVQNQGDKAGEYTTILLTGTRKGLKEAESSILAIVKEVEDTITVELEVEPKYYRDILGPKGVTKNAIIAKAGGSEDQQRRLLQIPDQGSSDKKISSTGSKKIVESIIEQVKALVAEKERSIVETLSVPKDKHRVIIGQGGSVRRSLETEFNVNVNIPNSQSDSTDVKITGLPENVEKVKAKINELTADDWKASVDVPAYLHAAVSERGAFTRKVRLDNNVEIEHGNLSGRAHKLSSQFPTPPKTVIGSDEETIKFTIDEESEVKKDDVVIPWRLKGEAEDVAKVESQIKSRLEKVSKDDTSAFLWVKNPQVFRKVVGPQGSRLNNIRSKSGSQIYVPRNSDKVNDVIYLRGTKESLEKAYALLKSEIEKK